MTIQWPLVRRSKLDALNEKYERVQFGYDQGVLEGMRQAYVNVRATLADEMSLAGGIDGMKLRGFLVPLLSRLGTHEDRLLAEMKGNAKQREDFIAANTKEQSAHIDTFGQPCKEEK